jgi:hypothetical protein
MRWNCAYSGKLKEEGRRRHSKVFLGCDSFTAHVLVMRLSSFGPLY